MFFINFFSIFLIIGLETVFSISAPWKTVLTGSSITKISMDPISLTFGKPTAKPTPRVPNAPFSKMTLTRFSMVLTPMTFMVNAGEDSISQRISIPDSNVWLKNIMLEMVVPPVLISPLILIISIPPMLNKPSTSLKTLPGKLAQTSIIILTPKDLSHAI